MQFSIHNSILTLPNLGEYLFGLVLLDRDGEVEHGERLLVHRHRGALPAGVRRPDLAAECAVHEPDM